MQSKLGPFSDVSVIVPAYQSANTIERALRSIALQTVLPSEVVVVDDGSDDGTAEVARSVASAMNDIVLQVIEQQNRGAGAARNRGLRAAQGELIAFLDADDEWLPQKLQRSISIMVETGAGLVSHNYIRMEDGIQKEIDCTRHFQGCDDPFVSLYLRGNIATSTVLVWRTLIDRAGGFDSHLRSGQDFDLWLSIAGLKDARFHIFGETLTRYHVMEESISSRIAERHRCAMTILLRHANVLQGRGPLGKLNALVRTAIVSLQATAAHRAQGNTVAALAALAGAPFAVMRIGGAIYSGPLLWLWIGGGTLGYGIQFRSYVDPILNLVGLK